MAVLETTAERWQRLSAVVPDDLLKFKPAPDQWSALECLHHLLETEDVFYFRLQAFLTGEPEFPGYDPDAPENRMAANVDPKRLADGFSARRNVSLTTLRMITNKDLTRGSRHVDLGPVTLDQMLHEWAAHDLNHTIQAERTIAQPLIQSSGPWKPYFADLEIGHAE